MKKLMFIAAAFVLMASAASAQLSYGLKGGLNLANLTNFDSDIKPSFYVGGFCSFYFNDFIGLTPEVVYSRQGSADNEGDITGKAKLDYINIPLMVNLFLTDNLSLDLGPQFGMLVSASGTISLGSITGEVDMKDAIKPFDVSVGLGLTYDLGKVFVQGRYNLGLTDCNDTNLDRKWKNNVIQLGAGFRF